MENVDIILQHMMHLDLGDATNLDSNQKTCLIMK